MAKETENTNNQKPELEVVVKHQFESFYDGISPNYCHKDSVPIAYFSLDGRRVSRPSQGLYIVKYSDGSVIKQVYK